MCLLRNLSRRKQIHINVNKRVLYIGSRYVRKLACAAVRTSGNLKLSCTGTSKEKGHNLGRKASCKGSTTQTP